MNTICTCMLRARRVSIVCIDESGVRAGPVYGNHWVPGNLSKGQNIIVDASKSDAQLRNGGKICNWGLKGEEM